MGAILPKIAPVPSTLSASITTISASAVKQRVQGSFTTRFGRHSGLIADSDLSFVQRDAPRSGRISAAIPITALSAKSISVTQTVARRRAKLPFGRLWACPLLSICLISATQQISVTSSELT